MKLLLSIVLCLAIPVTAEMYSLMNFAPRGPAEIERFMALGPDVVHVYEDGSADFIVNSVEYPVFTGSGLMVTTRMDDLEGLYARQYSGRTMGGYLTWDELSAWMDDLHDTFPSISSAPTSIGNTYEGRPQMVVKLSSGNGFWDDDPALPNCWYDGLIHSREPASMRNIRFFMLWLCENYGGSGFCGLQATYILDNRELWFLPCNNIDGYVYNQTTSPGGGGMHRKNRNTSAGGDGVDLNRNWAVGWGGSGSSGDPGSSTYRGTAPLSEPECSNVDTFWQTHTPAEMHSTHAYGNILIYPWGYTDAPTTDAAAYDTHAEIMVQWGTGDQHGPSAQLLYYSSGNTRDHAYGIHGAMSWNHETGSDFAGFWPSGTEMVKLTRRNLRSYLVTAFLAGCPLDPHVPGTSVMEDPGTVEPPFSLNWSTVSTASAYALQELTGYEVLLDDNGSGTPFSLSGWSLSSSQHHSGSQSYHSNGTGTMTWTETVSIPENGGGRLSFWTYYNVPYGSNQGSIEVSTDGGANWFYLQTFGRNDPNWRLNIHELDEWAGETLSFRWATTGSSSSMYVDDIKVEVWETNEFIDLEVPGTTYTFSGHEPGDFWYRVVAMDPDFGPGWPSEPVHAQVITTGIEEGSSSPGAETTWLGPVSPNPAAGSAIFELGLSAVDRDGATLVVYDLTGRLVTDLSDRLEDRGDSTVNWDCSDVNGEAVPGGLYFLVLRTGGGHHMQNLIVSR